MKTEKNQFSQNEPFGQKKKKNPNCQLINYV